MNKKIMPTIMGIVLTGCALNSYAQVNNKLSNLAFPTAVNQSLVPGTGNAINLGNSTKQWKSLHLHDALYLNGVLTIHATGSDNYFNGPDAGNTGVTDFGANTATGTNALHSLTTGYENTASGAYALYSNTTGIGNTASGIRTLYSNTIGTGNTANGFFALFSNIKGSENTANGDFALFNNIKGNNNTASGYYALVNNLGGINNTADGVSALESNTSGNHNTALGVYAGAAICVGNRNTFVGYHANAASSSLNNATALGSWAIVNASNQVRIGNSAVTSIGGYVNWSTVSDGRVKKNMKNNVPGLLFINKLNPITYNLDLEAADKIIQPPLTKTKDGKIAAPEQEDIAVRKAKEQVVYTGFIAQEVEKTAKELKYDFSGVDAAKNDKDLYGLRYADFVVPLVKAVQELSKMNDEKDVKIDELTARIEKLEAIMNIKQSGATNTIDLTSATLEQNAPNPFSNTSIINYSLADAHSSAKIIITDKSGRALKEVNISGNSKGSIQIDASDLSAGTYQYSLYVNQKLISSRQMVVSK